MKYNKKILIISFLMSFGLLTLFSVLNLLYPEILSVDNKWIFISGIPFLIGLFLAGIIKSFKGFGIELEALLAENVDVVPVVTVESSPTPSLMKESLPNLLKMEIELKHTIERLQFIDGRKEYDSAIVGQYISHLHNLRYIEIIDNDGKFKALLPVSMFKDNANIGNLEGSDSKINSLIRSIENGKVTENFKDIITVAIKKSDSLIDAYEKFKKTDQGILSNGDQVLPVINSFNKMIGLTSKIILTEKIADQIIKSLN